jgi:hypothetical protein
VLDRPRSPAAARNRELRARQRKGVRWLLRVQVSTRRLTRALQCANPKLPEAELTREEIEAELNEVIEDFIARWLGPKK